MSAGADALILIDELYRAGRITGVETSCLHAGLICVVRPAGPMLHIRKNLLKFTQAEMAALTGVAQATVSRWENGELEPSRTEMVRIRDEARRRQIAWDDKLFFDSAPASTEAA